MHSRGFGVPRPRTLTQSVTRLVVGAVTLSLTAFGLMALTTAPANAAQTKTLAAGSSLAMAPLTYERRVQRIVNKRRANHDLPRLRVAACATTTAKRWSRHLAANNQFYHQSMTTVLNRCNARYAGETLGRGSMAPRKLVRMWMQSPGHRAVLLSSKSRRIGVGATTDAYGRWVVAANFVRF
jgi:uncharacterized protein YkwD